jgi:hypothetical protein
MMDAHETLVVESEISVAVMGRDEDFVLIRLQGEIGEDLTSQGREKGYAYCGVLGVKGGQAGAKCAPNPDAVYTMMRAALGFAQLFADRLKQKSQGDAVGWLTALFGLPDTRT